MTTYKETLSGILGEQGNKGIYFRGNKCLKMSGTGEQRHLWGTGNIGNQDFDLGEQGNKVISFQGNRYPQPLGGPL